MSEKPVYRVPAGSPMIFDASGYVSDGFVNFVSKLGTGSDKSTFGQYALNYFAMMDVEAAYRTSWFRKIVDVIPFDEVREWRTWSGGADPKQVQAIDDEEKRLGYRQKVKEARTLARKDGGAAIVIGTNDRDLSSEIDIQKIGIGGVKYLTVCNRTEIQPGDKDQNPLSSTFGEPKVYRIAVEGARDIHPSRIIRFIGNPIRQMGYWDGWGDSLWMELRTAIRNSDQIAAAVAALVEEAKVDVISLENLANNMVTTEAENQLVRRFSAMGTLKSMVNALVIDKNDDYTQKTLTFQGLTDIQSMALMIMSGMADIPATRLLGRSPQGMNATGESDMRNYYDKIRAGQQVDLGPVIAPMDAMMVRSALGDWPAGIIYKWNPLYQMTDKEAADLEKVYADTVTVYANNGTVPDEALAAMTKNGIIERGNFPDAQGAFDDATEDAPILAEPTAADLAEEQARTAVANATVKDPTGAATQKPRLVANDAKPRSLYISRPVVNQDEIKRWAKSQGFTSTTDDMHVTIAMTWTELDWMKLPATWMGGDKDGEMTVQPGGARIVEPLGAKGAVVLLFGSSELSWRHGDLKQSGATWDFEDYQPHITLTYEGVGMDLNKVDPYRGKIVLGPEIWTERKEMGTIEHPETE